MNRTFDRRLSRLEAAAGVNCRQSTIFVRFIKPDGSSCELDRAKIDDRIWRRRKGEPENAFVRRIEKTAQRYKAPVVLLLPPESS